VADELGVGDAGGVQRPGERVGVVVKLIAEPGRPVAEPEAQEVDHQRAPARHRRQGHRVGEVRRRLRPGLMDTHSSRCGAGDFHPSDPRTIRTNYRVLHLLFTPQPATAHSLASASAASAETMGSGDRWAGDRRGLVLIDVAGLMGCFDGAVVA
jgi:hypothetical protein